MYLVPTRKQYDALIEFQRATESVLSAPKYDGAFDWWTGIARRVSEMGIQEYAREIYANLAKPIEWKHL